MVRTCFIQMAPAHHYHITSRGWRIQLPRAGAKARGQNLTFMGRQLPALLPLPRMRSENSFLCSAEVTRKTPLLATFRNSQQSKEPAARLFSTGHSSSFPLPPNHKAFPINNNHLPTYSISTTLPTSPHNYPTSSVDRILALLLAPLLLNLPAVYL